MVQRKAGPVFDRQEVFLRLEISIKLFLIEHLQWSSLLNDSHNQGILLLNFNLLNYLSANIMSCSKSKGTHIQSRASTLPSGD